MDVLLINTPFLPLDYADFQQLPIDRQERTSVLPPLGICYLSSYLKQRGYRVGLLDLNVETFDLLKRKGYYNLRDIVHLIRQRYAEIIGISCLSSTRYKQAHQIAQICKSLGSIVIMGGNYPTNSPEMALQDTNVDYVVLGEGEVIFYKLIRAIEEDVGWNELSGIGNRISLQPRQYTDFIQDLDTLPFPDYGSLDIEKYYSVGMSQSMDGNHRFFTLFTSRGCPNQCIFCGSHNVFGYKNRVRSPENVLKEIDWLIDKYGTEELLIQDDNFTVDRQRVDTILDNLASRKLLWSTPNGLEANSLDRTFLEKAKKSGATDLTIAVESASPRVLEMIRKKVDLEKVRQLIKDMRELGIYSKVFFMVGFPGETKEDIKKTIDFASELKADWSSFSIVNPLPGTELAKKTGVNLQNIGYANAYITTPEFTAEYIKNTVNQANTRINFLENPNLNGGNIEWAIRDFKRILERYPQHKVARESLERAESIYHRR